jgi:hypothetical protein
LGIKCQNEKYGKNEKSRFFLSIAIEANYLLKVPPILFRTGASNPKEHHPVQRTVIGLLIRARTKRKKQAHIVYRRFSV